MHFYTQCKFCFQEITIPAPARDKFILAKKLSEIIPLICKFCGKRNEVQVIDVKAEESKIKGIIAASIFLCGTIILFILFWDLFFHTSLYGVLSILGIIMVPYFIYEGMNNSERNRVEYFNTKQYG